MSESHGWVKRVQEERVQEERAEDSPYWSEAAGCEVFPPIVEYRPSLLLNVCTEPEAGDQYLVDGEGYLISLLAEEAANS